MPLPSPRLVRYPRAVANPRPLSVRMAGALTGRGERMRAGGPVERDVGPASRHHSRPTQYVGRRLRFITASTLMPLGVILYKTAYGNRRRSRRRTVPPSIAPASGQPGWTVGTDRPRRGRRRRARGPQGRSIVPPRSARTPRAGEIRVGPFISVWPGRPEARRRLTGQNLVPNPKQHRVDRLPPPTGAHSPHRTKPPSSPGVSWLTAPGPEGPA